MFNSTVLAHPHVYYLICGSTVHGLDQQHQINNSLQHQGEVAPQVSHSKREGERGDGHATRRERNEFIFLQSVAAAAGPARGAAGMDSKMKVNITDGARRVLLVLVLLLHQHGVSQKLDGSLVLM